MARQRLLLDPTQRVLRGQSDAVRETDKLLVWGGNIWDWLDPLTPIRAVAKIARVRDDVKLFFRGVRHPDPAAQRMEMTERAVRLACELGVNGTHDFFSNGPLPSG